MNHDKSADVNPSSDPNRFESDTQKIVRKHLEDKDHVITEDEIRNVRVGMTPSASETSINELTKESPQNNATNNSDEPLTSWDVVDR